MATHWRRPKLDCLEAHTLVSSDWFRGYRFRVSGGFARLRTETVSNELVIQPVTRQLRFAKVSGQTMHSRT